MLYMWQGICHDGCPDTYAHYRIPFAKSLEPNNILVLPEICAIPTVDPMTMNILWNIPMKKKYMWWLAPYMAGTHDLRGRFPIHLSQSVYTQEELRTGTGIESTILGDYIDPIFFSPYDPKKKQNKILCGPKTPQAWMDELRRKLPADVELMRLKGLDWPTLVRRMGEAKVYLSMDVKAGSDRLSREGVLQGCCIVADKQGGWNDIDLGIPTQYKIPMGDVDAAVKLAMDCINHYDERIRDFDSYLDYTNHNESVFEQQVRKIFKKE